MASAKEFGESIAAIEGIRSYLLVRKDGFLISHNVPNPKELATTVVISGLGAEAVKSSLGGSYFRYLEFVRDNKENLLVFPIEKYFLGIVQEAEAFGPELAEQVIRYIMTLTRKQPSPAT
jgi:predicted regulator of Ras-like GTPase activity (Roadblock/LC7/MglB family)